MNVDKTFDVIVIGGGHAGTEAALAAARMGSDTLLLSHNIDTLGQMSCNPAIGGIGKGHLVKEIDALDGAMGLAADDAGIQFRTLNASKGPAVRATRAQADRSLYRTSIRKRLENQENLSLFQQAVDDLIVENGCAVGVKTQMGLIFRAKTVVLTVGTFLGGKIHVGTSNFSGGRAGDPPAIALAQRLRELPFNVGRLKTGTPPRIDSRSLNYSVMTEQPGDQPTPVFSFIGDRANQPRQISCHITHTTELTHQIIRDNLHKSAMYAGAIDGVGPRYCPSIEDKIVRFADKASHQIFVEPEGLDVCEIYPNGISTSLPFDVQTQFVRSIIGFENAHITRAGYAIEYDYFDPQDLHPSLETKHMSNLYFAGQINGTTGYEEAGAQGLLAGLNAALKAQEKESWSPRRDEAYIGVLVDDLITLGTIEPYRMFTSRAEYRLLLREDNADLRLTEQGYQLGVVSEHRYKKFIEKQEGIEKLKQSLKDFWIPCHSDKAEKIKPFLNKELQKDVSLEGLLKRPELNYEQLATAFDLQRATPTIEEQLEIQTKYSGYIERQQQDIEKLKRSEQTKIPKAFNYDNVSGLSNEVVQKLKKVLPDSIGQASRISGVTPAAVSLLLVHLKKQRVKINGY